MTEPIKRGRSRDATLAALREGLSRLRDAKARITISAVAREAGVTPALLHNRYPAIVDQIRRHTGSTARSDLLELRQELERARARVGELSGEVKDLKVELRHLASENEALRRAFVEGSGGNVVALRGSARAELSGSAQFKWESGRKRPVITP